MDIRELAESIGLDEDEYLEMLQLFIESGGDDLAGLEAAIAEGNAAVAHESAHSLKGSSGSLGLAQLFELSRTIDDRCREGLLDGLDAMVSRLREEYDFLIDAVAKTTGG